MFRFHAPLNFLLRRSSLLEFRHNLSFAKTPSWIDIRPNISAATKAGKPVVAFETAIVTHGLPRPINFELNNEIKGVCEKHGVTAAPVGFIEGKLVIGLTSEELAFLASGQKHVEKIARLDIAKAVSKKLSGGTTVSSTMWAAHIAAIKIFVTGGIGGVHRGWQETLDISSDLTELSRTPVVVICAGSKSILDIPATLEYLETMGVPVATLHPEGYFPAFHSTSSGVKIPLRLKSHEEAVPLIQALFSMEPPPSGMLIACPIPEKFSIPASVMEQRIQSALKKAAVSGVSGKATTPFLLSEIAKASSGETVKANIQLVLNNTETGCRIAAGLAASDAQSKQNFWNVSNLEPKTAENWDRPVILGGSVLDAYGKFLGPSTAHTRATESGRVFLSAGGVGRNVADCIARVMNISEPANKTDTVDKRPLLISVLSTDSVGKMVVSMTTSKLDVSGIKWLDKQKTGFYSPSYVGTLANTGQYLVGIGDFIAMEQFFSNDLLIHETSIAKAPLVVTDGNLHRKVYPQLLEFCSKNKVPIYIECTDIYKATRPFLCVANGKDIKQAEIPFLDCVAAISPNFEEFLQLIQYFVSEDAASECRKAVSGKQSLSTEDLAPLVKAGRQLVFCHNSAPNVFLKLGRHGVMVMRRSEASAPLPIRPWSKPIENGSGKFSAVFYGSEPSGWSPKIMSVSGAGDCLIGTIIGLTLSQQVKTLDAAIRAGIRAACLSLESEAAVPETITPMFLLNEECKKWCEQIPRKDVSFLAE